MQEKAFLGLAVGGLALAIAGGVFFSFATSLAVAGAQQYTRGRSFSDAEWDDWGANALVSELVGGALGALSYGIGNLATNFARSTVTSKFTSLASENADAIKSTTTTITNSIGSAFGAFAQTAQPIHVHPQASHTRPMPVAHTRPMPVAVPHSSLMSQTPIYYRSYSSYTYSYSYSVYSYTINSLLYHTSVFSASNGYYEMNNGRSRIR